MGDTFQSALSTSFERYWRRNQSICSALRPTTSLSSAQDGYSDVSSVATLSTAVNGGQHWHQTQNHSGKQGTIKS